jgi:hypothetical protein
VEGAADARIGCVEGARADADRSQPAAIPSATIANTSS